MFREKLELSALRQRKYLNPQVNINSIYLRFHIIYYLAIVENVYTRNLCFYLYLILTSIYLFLCI